MPRVRNAIYPPPPDIFARMLTRPGVAAPPCRAMGAHCRGLRVILRVTSLDDGPRSGDHEATWLLGHTERITFLSDLWEDDGDLYVAAELKVPCQFLSQHGGMTSCGAFGYTGKPTRSPPSPPAPRRLGPDRFRIVESGRLASRSLPSPEQRPRSLPVHHGTNPCAGAPCRTADNRRGAACCRDLQIEIMCTTREKRLEALIRARRSPYLCKISRESPFSLGVEMISACGFLLDDGVHCSLHGRTRADGRPAKPDLCSEWPEGGEIMHPGCVFAKR
jgi:hypothetical protein